MVLNQEGYGKEETLMGRRAFLRGVGALAGAVVIYKAFGYRYLWAQLYNENNKERDFSVDFGTPLRDRAARKGFIYGAASGDRLLIDEEFAALFVTECGILVPESELKWSALRPTLDTYNFAPADWLAGFAQRNNMLFRGHTLVWHRALPKWFHNTVNSQNVEKVLREHIAAVVGHYAGRMHSWDVVNEAVLPWDRQPGSLRNTPWLRLLGPKYIEIAFRAAAEADPNALLVLNQNHLEYDTKGAEECRTATLKLLQHLKTSGTPVHTLGIQAHLIGHENSFNPNRFRAFLQNVACLGLKIMITELDVADCNLPFDIGLRDRIVAGKYEDFLSVVLEEPAVIAVLTWGVSDKSTWLAEDKPRDDKATVRPLLFDEKYNRKLSWNAIARAFEKAPNR
jgi:endo-1,4-beta-xylanase